MKVLVMELSGDEKVCVCAVTTNARRAEMMQRIGTQQPIFVAVMSRITKLLCDDPSFSRTRTPVNLTQKRKLRIT